MTANLPRLSPGRSAELNMREWYLRILLAAGGEIHHANGIVWGYGERSLPHQGRGGIIPFPGASGADFAEPFRRMQRDFAARDGAPWCTMGRTTTPPELRAAFKAVGFTYMFPGLCMAGNLEPEPLMQPMVPGIAIKLLEDVPATAIGEHPSYGQPGEERDTMLAALGKLAAASPRRFWPFVALRGDVLVGSTTLYIGRHAAGIYDVGTLAPERSCGVASALIATACLKARALGWRTAVLQCDPSLRNFYGRFGFHEVSTIDHWSSRSAMQLLEALPAGSELTAAEDFLTAALTGDIETARRLLHDHPTLARQPLAGLDGATPMHFAAYHGAIEAARMLLDADADFDSVERRFDSTPLGWAIYGLGPGGPVFKRDQWGVANRLLAAGARLTPELAKSLRQTEPARAAQMLADTSEKPRLAAVLRNLGDGD